RAWSGLLVGGGSWLLVLVAAGLLALRRAPAREAARVPLAIACMHLGYGAGAAATLEPHALEHLEDYTTEVCVALPELVVAVTRYPGYPIARFDDARF